MASPDSKQAKTPPDGRLPADFQERLLEQMRQEQAAALRQQEIRNYVLLPLAALSLMVGIALMFSDDLAVALLANIVTTGLVTVLWRTNREWIRNRLGL